MRTVTLYGRPGCHLCADAASLLAQLRREGRSFEVAEVNIESDPVLHARYLERIPVVEIEGQIVSELEPNADTLRQSLDTLGT